MKLQKKLAGKIAKRSPNKVKLDPKRIDEINEAITRADIKSLIKDSAININQKKGVSRVRARIKSSQKVRGRQKGHGSRKGTANARLSKKRIWIDKIKLQRLFLKQLKLKKKITPQLYKELYKKSKGGFFRSKRHIMLYLKEHKLLKNGK